MYYPKLENMRQYLIDDLLIHKLDVWLGTRRKAVRKYLNPLAFSFECGIDEEIAIRLFAVCTDPKLSLLKARYIVECPHCDGILASFEDAASIPIEMECPETDQLFKVNKQNIVIVFTLSEDPQQQPYQENTLTGIGPPSGKPISLRADRVENSSDEMVRRLLDLMDTRI